ncbi:histone H2B.1, sperm-like [Apteryx mantelli]|uniref:Histone H2B.1, sperm-like n=1 Tax=Apteryx mantelli TaxID=2696672 RepID=A0ABM4FXQ7_9AVES
MASARGGRRRSRHRHHHRRHHHHQRPNRRRRSPGKRRPGGRRVRGGRRRCSSQPIDSRTLRQIKRDSKLLSSKAKGLMIRFVDDVSERVSREAERLRKESRRPAVSPEHMQAALRHVMPKRRRRQVPGVGSRCWR